MLTLWQAEWCPYSARVRETLTELGVDFVARQVPADKAKRDAMRAETGKDSIPLLVLEDGTQIAEWQEAIQWLREHHAERPDEAEHRRKWIEEAPERHPLHELR